MLLGAVRIDLRKDVLQGRENRPRDVGELLSRVRAAESEAEAIVQRQRRSYQNNTVPPPNNVQQNNRPFQSANRPANGNRMQPAKPKGERCKWCKSFTHESENCPVKEIHIEKLRQKKITRQEERRNELLSKHPPIDGTERGHHNLFQICNVLIDEASPPLFFNIKMGEFAGTAQCDHGADFSVCSKSLYPFLLKTNPKIERMSVPIRQTFGEAIEFKM